MLQACLQHFEWFIFVENSGLIYLKENKNPNEEKVCDKWVKTANPKGFTKYQRCVSLILISFGFEIGLGFRVGFDVGYNWFQNSDLDIEILLW